MKNKLFALREPRIGICHVDNLKKEKAPSKLGAF